MNIIPFVQTDDSRCGPASVKMVLSHYGINAHEDELCKRCDWSYERGCTNLGIKRALESYGLQCTIYSKQSISDIKKFTDRDIPVIVDWFTGGVDPGPAELPNGHSSVIVNVDDKNVHLLDPEDGNMRVIPHNEFNRCWFDWTGSPTISPENLRIRQMIVAIK